MSKKPTSRFIEAATGAGIVAWVRDFGFMPLAAELPEREYAQYESDLAREAEELRSNGVIRLGGITRLVVAR